MDHPSNSKLAFDATIHCLFGCGIGEVLGVIVGVALGLHYLGSLIIGVMAGFLLGFLIGMLPLLRVNKTPWEAFKIIFLAEFVSIAVMETGEVLAELFIPGLMGASLTTPLFWWGMLGALTTGFIFAYPINYVMVKRGMKHHH